MTKLEEKLIELGYEQSNVFRYYYIKKLGKYILQIGLERNLEHIEYSCVEITIYNQQDIDNLQQAYNQLQKDLEELKQYEN